MKAPAKLRKALQGDRYSNCAYIYNDGVVLREHITARIHGLKKDVEMDVVHIWPFTSEDVRCSVHNRYGERFIGRVVCSNPTLLIDGISRIEVYRDNNSDRTKEMGIKIDTITLTSDSGMKLRADDMSIFSSEMCFQNDKPMSCIDWDCYEYRDRIIWHGSKPEELKMAA